MAEEANSSAPTPDTPQRTTGGNFRWEPPSPGELQAQMPGYTIEKILGRGGMGAVYRGVQTNLDRPVAIKILPPGVEKEDPSFAERFRNEAKLMAKLNHPAVVAVHDFGTTLGGQLYFAMEYVDGSDVSQMIAAQGRLPPEHALAITAHVCDALAAAHELGIVHRDIKPANVLLNMKGQVKVADFGLAKVEEPGQHGLTKTGYAMGTPDFVAPEALTLGTAIDGRADLYAVGVMLYQMLTGNIPRGAFKPASVLVPGLDPRFDPIILKAMQHDREERHQDAMELRRELDVILTVPLVQHDAPVSAAIPVAQIAEVPGQRSAAQRPQQSRPGVATARPAAGGSATDGRAKATPVLQPRSKAPLFLGLGAAAAIGIGAFVMMGGKKQTTKPSTPAPSAAKPAQGTERTTLNPPTPPKPTPPVSKSPSPPASKSVSTPPASKASDPAFPPGQWVKLYTLFEHLPKELQNPDSEIKVEKGWIRLGQQMRSVELPSILKTNYAVRARFLRHGGDDESARIIMRDTGRSGDYYQAIVQNSLVIHEHEGANWKTLKAASATPIAADQQYLLEFGVVGDRLVARSGTAFATITNSTYPQGPARIFGAEDMRDIEVINLDGLSEAEALKILGVDEKGNDLRQKPATVASATPAASSPTPSVSKSSTAPASSSPSLPISQSSDPKFPPGQWVKVFTKFEDLPVELRKAGVRFEGGWMRSEIGKAPRLYLLDSLSNYAIRATMQRQGKEYQTKSLMIRAADLPSVAGYVLCLSMEGFWFAGRKLDGAPIEILWQAHDSTVRVPRIGEEYTLEWGCVGDKLIGRIGKDFVKVITDSKWNRGPGYFTGGEPLRDIEVINLDGIPEAEALRILGVDEKGNDLRALAAKQEQQKAEQAKVVDAMAAIPELKALHEQFVKLQGERVTAPFEAEVAKLNAGYVGGIDREIANEKKAGHLDGVIALEAEKKLIQGMGASGPQSSGGARGPRSLSHPRRRR